MESLEQLSPIEARYRYRIWRGDQRRRIHRRRSSINFRERQKNARILHDSCPKSYQNTRIFMIFARKINKIPEFYMMFARKSQNFT